jgi:hypothetical protein
LLNELRRGELEARKQLNQEEEHARLVRSKKDALLEVQSSSVNKQKTIELTKGQIQQKRALL